MGRTTPSSHKTPGRRASSRALICLTSKARQYGLARTLALPCDPTRTWCGDRPRTQCNNPLATSLSNPEYYLVLSGRAPVAMNACRGRGMLKGLSIVGYVGMAGGLVAQLATGNLVSPSPVVIAPQVGAVLLLLWARLTFGRRSFHAVANPTEGGLVTTGPYRYIRHPIYTAVVLFSGVGALAHWHSLVGGLLFAGIFGGSVLRIFCEETLITARYPKYRQYAATTWRMIPYIF
jgi:protein-S-isoprenylcysteine O-methyltransferase Ste14